MKSIFVFLILMLLSSCGVKRQVSKSNETLSEKTEQSASVQINEKVKSEKNKDRHISSDTDREIKTVIVEFDTDKPVDPVTGRSPVKSEVVIVETSRNKTSESFQSVELAREEITVTEDADIKTDTQIQAQQEVKVSAKSRGGFWWGAGIAILLIAVLLVVYKKGSIFRLW